MKGLKELLQHLKKIKKIPEVMEEIRSKIEEFLTIHYSKSQGIKDVKSHLLSLKNPNPSMIAEETNLLETKMNILSIFDPEKKYGQFYRQIFDKIANL